MLCSVVPRAVDDPGRALELARRAVASDDKNPQYLMALGAAEHRAGEDQAAVETLTRSVARVPDPPLLAQAHLFLALAYHRLGRSEEAHRALADADRALAAVPDMPNRFTLLTEWEWRPRTLGQVLRVEAGAAIGPPNRAWPTPRLDLARRPGLDAARATTHDRRHTVRSSRPAPHAGRGPPGPPEKLARPLRRTGRGIRTVLCHPPADRRDAVTRTPRLTTGTPLAPTSDVAGRGPHPRSRPMSHPFPSTRFLPRRPRGTRARNPHLELEHLEGRQLLTSVGVPGGLVSWWTADGTAADLKGLNNANLFNGTTYTAGKVGQAFKFDGVNDRVEVADSPSLALTGSLSIEGWIKVNALPSASQGLATVLFRGDDRGGLDPYQLTLDSTGALWFQVVSAAGESARVSAPVATGQLMHVAATLDDATGEMTLYVNGGVVAQTVTSARPFGALDPAYNPGIGIGNANGNATGSGYNIPFNGLIDELSVYDRALTRGEVLGISSAGAGGKVRAANYFAADFPSVVEGPAAASSTATFTISRVGSLAGQAVVNWSTANATATAGTDYVAASGQVVFQDGESQKTVQVTVNGDGAIETDETFWLVLSTSTPGYATGGGLATIRNDDASVSVNDAQVNEGDPRFGRLGPFVEPSGNGGLNRSTGMVYGPDGNLYVGSQNTDEVLRYDAATGAFLGPFVTAGSGGLNGPSVDGLIFRPDGRLYVGSKNSNSVLRYDATTGAFLDAFVPTGSGGLLEPKGMTFAPDGSLLVSSGTNEVLRYSGTTGAFLGPFVAAGSGGLTDPRSLAFGPDGNLYVSSGATNSVLKYSGTTGTFLGTFIPANSGGLINPGDLLFADGRLYVASQNTNQVLRYDAANGEFIDDAVPAGSGGLDRPIGLMLDANQNLLVGGFAGVIRYTSPSPAYFTVSLSGPSPRPSRSITPRRTGRRWPGAISPRLQAH